METTPAPHDPDGRRVPAAAGRAAVLAVLGALVGFGVGAGTYLAVNPVLEASDGWVRELQGLLWNVVPFLTVVGGAVGLWLATRRHD